MPTRIVCLFQTRGHGGFAAFAHLHRHEPVEQRVVAVYFDKNRRVARIANYGEQDGKIFDYISRTTPTSGQELNYLTYVFKIFGGK